MGEGRNNLHINHHKIIAIKEVVLNANNTTAIINVFKLNKNIEIRELYCQISEGTIVNLTNLRFDLWDGTLSVPITATGLANLSGAEVGTFVVKDSGAAEIITVLLNNQARAFESISAKDTYQSFFVNQKFNVDTFIRLHYTTTETPINSKMRVIIQYNKTDSGFLEVEF